MVEKSQIYIICIQSSILRRYLFVVSVKLFATVLSLRNIK